MKKKFGFTLLEIIVVIIIVGIFAGILTPLATVAIRRVKIKTTKEKMETLNDALLLYYEDYGRFPSALTDLEPNYIRESEYSNDYADDAWRVNFVYTYNVGKVSATIRSYGPDRTGPDSDDILYIVQGKPILKKWWKQNQEKLKRVNEAMEKYISEGNTLSVGDSSEKLSKYLDKAAIYDTWGNPYRYSSSGTFYSYGPDGAPGGNDDIYPQGFPTP